MVGCERETNKCWGISKFACILYLLILYLTIKIHKCRFVIVDKSSIFFDNFYYKEVKRRSLSSSIVFFQIFRKIFCGIKKLFHVNELIYNLVTWSDSTFLTEEVKGLYSTLNFK